MKAFRCQEPHPRFAGKACDAVVLRTDAEGEFEVYCHRHRRAIWVDTRLTYTDSIDKAILVAVS